MSRRRSLKLLGAIAAASLVVAACSSGDDDDDAVSGDATEDDRWSRPPRKPPAAPRAPRPPRPRRPRPRTRPRAPPRARPPSSRAPTRSARRAAAPAASRTAPTRTTARTRPVRCGWPGTRPPYSFNTNTIRGNATANANISYLMTGGISQSGFTYYDEDLNLHQQRPVRHVHGRVARPADGHVHDQRGCHVDRRRAGRRRRHAADVGRPERRVQRRRHGRHRGHRRDGPGRRRGQRRSSSVPTAPRSTSADAAYAAAFDPEAARSSRATPTRSRPASRSTASESLQLITTDAGDLRRRPVADRDVGHVLRRLPDGRHVPGRPGPRRRPEGPRHPRPGGGQGGARDGVPGQGHGQSRPIAESWNTYFDATSLPDGPRRVRRATARTT